MQPNASTVPPGPGVGRAPSSDARPPPTGPAPGAEDDFHDALESPAVGERAESDHSDWGDDNWGDIDADGAGADDQVAGEVRITRDEIAGNGNMCGQREFNFVLLPLHGLCFSLILFLSCALFTCGCGLQPCLGFVTVKWICPYLFPRDLLSLLLTLFLSCFFLFFFPCAALCTTPDHV